MTGDRSGMAGLKDRPLHKEAVRGLAGGLAPGLVISFSASARAWAVGISAPDLST